MMTGNTCPFSGQPCNPHVCKLGVPPTGTTNVALRECVFIEMRKHLREILSEVSK